MIRFSYHFCPFTVEGFVMKALFAILFAVVFSMAHAQVDTSVANMPQDKATQYEIKKAAAEKILRDKEEIWIKGIYKHYDGRTLPLQMNISFRNKTFQIYGGGYTNVCFTSVISVHLGVDLYGGVKEGNIQVYVSSNGPNDCSDGVVVIDPLTYQVLVYDYNPRTKVVKGPFRGWKFDYFVPRDTVSLEGK